MEGGQEALLIALVVSYGGGGLGAVATYRSCGAAISCVTLTSFVLLWKIPRPEICPPFDGNVAHPDIHIIIAPRFLTNGE